MTSFGQPPPPPSGQSMMGGPFMSGGPPPPSMNGSMIGGPPPLSGGVGMMGRPPPPNNGAPVPFQGGGALVVSNQQSNPYAGMLGSGPPPPMAGPPPLPGQMIPFSSGMIGGPPPPPPMQPQMSQQSFHTQPSYGSGGAQQNPFAAPTPPRPGMMSQQSQQSLGQSTPQRPGFSSQQSQSSFGQQSLQGSFGQQPLQGSYGQQPSFAQQSLSMGQQSLQSSFGQQSLQPSFGQQQQQQPAGGPPPPSVPPPFPPPAAAPASNVFDPMAPPAPAPAPAFPAPAPPPPPAASSNALVPAAVQSDPWADMFGAPPPTIAPPPQPSSSSENLRKASDLTDGTFGVATTSQNNNDLLPVSSSINGNDNDANGGLPPGGDFYDARIFTPMLGVIFFRPQELKKSLFLDTHAHMVDALADRPTVAFILEGSSARAAGVDLGHVLVKVNGIDVKNPKEASRLVKEGPRPLPMLFYAPDTNVITSEGEHMVKYNNKDTNAPIYAKDWKPKFVVIGGVIAPNHMMHMYKSKTDYDTAVRESQARRPISVKVKRFSLQGARIQNDWQEPRMVKYKNKLHPWRYFVIIPAKGHPIKISSTDLAQLKPVHEGIRRLLLEQQRGGDSGNVRVPTAKSTYPPTTSSSARDVYGNRDGHGGSSWRGSSGGGTGSSVGGGESSMRRKTIDG